MSAADKGARGHRVRVSAGGTAQPVKAPPSTPVVAAATGVTATSTMIAVKPRPDEAAALEQLGGHEADTLHVTLVFLGDTEGSLDAVQAALQQVAAAHAPLEGKVAGIAAFAAGDDGAPSLVLPSVPGLVELRVAVTEALQAAGVDYSRLHGYVPHMTIAYDKTGYTFPSLDSIGQELHFDDLLIVRGDTEIIPLPLTGVAPLTAAADITFCLPANLRTKTDPVRQAVVESVMKPALEGAGITFDVLNPFTAKVLAQSGSKITEISQTTQAEVMRVIKLAHDEGLTIPDTAKAIQAHMAEAAGDRATLIARTELAGAVNGGSLAATQIVAEETGVSYKKTWMTAPGAHYPRHDDYEGLDGQQAGLDGYFDVGGSSLQFPGDPDGPAEEVCNCRCTMRYADGGITDTDLQAAGVKTVTATHHTRVLHAANKRIDEELEQQLAAILVPILVAAGDYAAQQFTRHAHDAALTADGGPAGWSIPAPEEVLATSCELPGAAEAAAGARAALKDTENAIETMTDGPATVYLDKEFDPWGEALSQQEKDALTNWKSESGYQQINDYLRFGTAAPGVEEKVALIDAAIASAPRIGEGIETVVYRGVKDIRATLGDDVRVGNIVTDKGFQSVTTEEGVASDYATARTAGLIKIELPPDSSGAWLRSAGVEKRSQSGYDYYDTNENREMVLARNQRYEVVSVGRHYGLPVVTLRQLP